MLTFDSCLYLTLDIWDCERHSRSKIFISLQNSNYQNQNVVVDVVGWAVVVSHGLHLELPSATIFDSLKYKIGGGIIGDVLGTVWDPVVG